MLCFVATRINYTVRLNEQDVACLETFLGNNLFARPTSAVEFAARVGLKFLSGSLTRADVADVFRHAPGLKEMLLEEAKSYEGKNGKRRKGTPAVAPTNPFQDQPGLNQELLKKLVAMATQKPEGAST